MKLLPKFDSAPHELDKKFYSSYDPQFIVAKARALVYVLDHREAYSAELSAGQRDMEPVTDQNFSALAAELFFSEMHQFEALWALMLAPLEPTPDWVYLCSYRQRAIDQSIRAFLQSHDWDGYGWDTPAKWKQFIDATIYWGSRPTSRDLFDRWEENLDNIVWLLRRVAARYDQPEIYNAYKHGLRFFAGATSFSLYPHGKPEHGIHRKAEHSITMIEPRADDQGDRRLWSTTTEFSPVESFAHITYMARIAETIRETRLARSTGLAPKLNTFVDMDRRGILSNARSWRFSRNL